MQVRMVTMAAGPLGVMQAGQVVEVTEAMGAALIAVGAAVVEDGAPLPGVEHAVAPPAETATAKRKRK